MADRVSCMGVNLIGNGKGIQLFHWGGSKGGSANIALRHVGLRCPLLESQHLPSLHLPIEFVWILLCFDSKINYITLHYIKSWHPPEPTHEKTNLFHNIISHVAQGTKELTWTRSNAITNYVFSMSRCLYATKTLIVKATDILKKIFWICNY